MLKIGKRVSTKSGLNGIIEALSGDSVTIKLRNGHKREIPSTEIDFIRTEAGDLVVGDVIEDSSNQATWTIEQIEANGSMRYLRAGTLQTLVLSTTEFWKLHRS